MECIILKNAFEFEKIKGDYLGRAPHHQKPRYPQLPRPQSDVVRALERADNDLSRCRPCGVLCVKRLEKLEQTGWIW